MRGWTPAGAPRFRLSSGTEDYFLGTFYFNKGQYFLPQAGVSSLCPPTNPGNPESIDCSPRPDNSTKFAAYRLHIGDDPLLFERGAAQSWRNSDLRGCPWPTPPYRRWVRHRRDVPASGVVKASSLALVYEW